jgi:hypothetical protein
MGAILGEMKIVESSLVGWWGSSGEGMFFGMAVKSVRI